MGSGRAVDSASESESTSPNWALRAYKKGDEDRITALWSEVFGLSYPLSRWKWCFNDNPYPPIDASLACTDDGQIVGQYTARPIQVNYRGKPLPGCLGLDSMVHQAFRGQGLYLKLERDFSARCAEQGMRITYGPPHKNSYPAQVNYLGWDRITFLRRYRRRVALQLAALDRRGLRGVGRLLSGMYGFLLRFRLRFARYRLLRRGDNQPTFHSAPSVPSGYDKLWRSVRPYEVISVWKDEEYLRWRYEMNVDHDFVYYYLSNGEDIVALSVLQRGSGRLHEFIVKDRNIKLGRILLNYVLCDRIGRTARNVTFLAYDFGFFDECFSREFDRQIDTRMPIDAKVWGNGNLREDARIAENWTITLGDLD